MTSKSRPWVINALIVALYIVLSIVSNMFNLAVGPVQFRLSESLNHLVAFDRRYLFGVTVGVVLFNAMFSPMGWVDVVFGGGQTLIGLGIVWLVGDRLPAIWQRMALTTVVMSLSMIIIAWEIVWTGHLGMGALWGTYLTLCPSEFVIMLISAPVMLAIDRAVHFSSRLASTK